jgi:hypothetical protein
MRGLLRYSVAPGSIVARAARCCVFRQHRPEPTTVSLVWRTAQPLTQQFWLAGLVIRSVA